MAVIVVEKDIDRQLTIISVTGETTAEEITRTIVAHNSHEVTKLILWDLTKAMIQSLTGNQVRDLAQTTQQFIERREGGKTAIVVPSDLGFGLARMYDIVQENTQVQVSHMTFRGKELALQWLLE